MGVEMSAMTAAIFAKLEPRLFPSESMGKTHFRVVLNGLSLNMPTFQVTVSSLEERAFPEQDPSIPLIVFRTDLLLSRMSKLNA